MKNKSKSYKILTSVLAFIFSSLACGLGLGLLGATDSNFVERFFIGFVFMMTPMCTIWMIMLLFKK